MKHKRYENLNKDGAEYVRNKMPKIGLGTYQIQSGITIFNILDTALDVGYRFIDTAQVYQNEQHIGKALAELMSKYGLKREDIFITSKLAPANQGLTNCRESVMESLNKLKTKYLDLLLIHWPGVSKLKRDDPKNAQMRAESWKELEILQKEGKLRAIGISNYNIVHLEELLESAEMLPAVNQCECHPHWVQSDLIQYCRENDIHFQAYSSFGSESNRDDLFADQNVCAMAAKYECSVPTFLLAWALAQGMSVLPRSKNPDHVRQNFTGPSQIHVSAEDIEAVKATKSKMVKYCWDPKGLS